MFAAAVGVMTYRIFGTCPPARYPGNDSPAYVAPSKDVRPSATRRNFNDRNETPGRWFRP